jgi:MFS family permease
VAALFFINGATVASWFPRLPEIRDRLGVSEAGLGLTLVGMGLGGLLVSLSSGAIVDRFGSRTISVLTSVVLSVLLPLIAFASVPVALFTLLVFMGSCDGLTDVAMNRQALIVQDELRRGGHAEHVMSRLHGMWSVGTLAGGLVSARLAATGVPLRAHLTVAGTLFAATALVARRWLVADRPRVPEPTTTPVAKRRGVAPVLVRLFLVGTAVALAEAPPNDWAALMWEDHYSLSEGRAALGYVAIAAGMVAGRFSGDYIVARLGREPTRRGGAAMAAAGVAVATLAPVPALSAIGMFATGFGVSQLFPLMFAAGSDATRGRSSGMAAFSSGARFGFLLAPPLVGIIAERTSIATAVLAVAGTAAVIVAIVEVD